MRFGKTLKQSIYEPWRDKYIEYDKLKSLLREDRPDDDEPWTEEDEVRFCDEIFNVQLEKVAQFQEEKMQELRQRVDAAFDKLKDLPPADSENKDKPTDEALAQRLKELEAELDAITNEVSKNVITSVVAKVKSIIDSKDKAGLMDVGGMRSTLVTALKANQEALTERFKEHVK